MSRLPFPLILSLPKATSDDDTAASDALDSILYHAATIAAVIVLEAGGCAVGYLIGLWLF